MTYPMISKKHRGQGLVEFALILPVLLLLLMGTIDFGRALFTYGQASAQLRQALRMASTVGDPNAAIPTYKNCAAMRNKVKSVFFADAISDADINVMYLRVNSVNSTGSGTDLSVWNSGTGQFTEPQRKEGSAANTDFCETAETAFSNPDALANGDLLRIRTDYRVNMITPFFPPQLRFTMEGQRTIVKSIDIYTEYCGDLICQPDNGEDLVGEPTFCLQDCASADLKVEITSDPQGNDYKQLKPFQYIVTVTNLGYTPATKVKLQVALPPSVQYQPLYSCLPAQCTDNGSTATNLSINLGDIGFPTNNSIQVTILVLAVQTGPALATATVSAKSPDPDDTNNIDTDGPTITVPEADISISKGTSESNTVPFDSQFTYKIFVASDQNIHNKDSIVKDYLPSCLGYISATPAPNNPVPVSGTSGTLTWTVSNLTANVAYPIQVTVKAIAEGPCANSVEIFPHPSITDTTPINTFTAPPITILPPTSGLAISKSVSSNVVGNGQAFTYTITLDNNVGPNAAANVVVTDTFPAGVTFVSQSTSPSPGVTFANGISTTGCPSSSYCNGGPLTWTFASALVKNASYTITINATASQIGSFNNQVDVTTSTQDDASNNTSLVGIGVETLPPPINLRQWVSSCTTKKLNKRYPGLIWDPVTGAAGYYVYVYDTATSAWVKIGNLKTYYCGKSLTGTSKKKPGCFNLPGATTYWHTKTTLTYAVTAYDALGNESAMSAPLNIAC